MTTNAMVCVYTVFGGREKKDRILARQSSMLYTKNHAIQKNGKLEEARQIIAEVEKNKWEFDLRGRSHDVARNPSAANCPDLCVSGGVDSSI